MKNNNKLFYLTGTALSSLGDGIQQIAIMWLVYSITENPLTIGIMIAINYFPPLILAPFMGVYADHRDAKKLSVTIDILRFITVAVLALQSYFGANMIGIIYVLQGLLAVCNMAFKPAIQSLIKESFQQKDLVFVVSKSSSINETATIIGSGLAGILVAYLPISLCFLINALTFLFSAAFNSQLKHIQDKDKKSKGKIEYIKDLKEGWNYIVQKSGLMYLIFLSTISSASLQLTMTILLPYATQLGGTSKLYSAFDITFTVGGALAGLVLSNRLFQRWGHRLLVISTCGIALLSFLNSIVGDSRILIFVCLFGLGFFTMFHMTMMHSLIQLNATREMMGRVVGLRSIVASLTKIASSLLTGFLIGLVSIEVIFMGFSFIVLFTMLTFSRIKKIEIPV